jgi:hypothetical protein
MSSIGVQKKIYCLLENPPTPTPHHFSNGPSLKCKTSHYFTQQAVIHNRKIFG